jgi:monoamine oxidase
MSLSRREFLVLSTASAAGVLAGCAGDSVAPVGGEYDVLVIGAGVAGLATGQKLRSLGLSAAILEAQPRTGGRCFVDNSFPAPFDFGGQFFHQVVPNPLGGTNNPLYDLYRSQGGVEMPVDLAPKFCENGAILPEGDQLPFQSMVASVMGEVSLAGMAAQAGAPDISGAEATSEFVGMPWYSTTMAFAELTLDATPEKLSCLDAWNDIQYALNPNGSPSDRVNPAGMGNFINQFKDGLTIMLSTPVTEIDTRDANRIKVTTPRGTLTAKAVVVTVPMTLLALGRIRFVPDLPTVYDEAFHSLPFGLVDKVGLRFSSNVFAGLPPNTMVTRHVQQEHFTMALAGMAAKPNMMNLLVGGELASDLEAGGEQAFLDYSKQFLTDTFDASVASAVDKIVVHPWGQDLFTMGSYSSALPGKAGARVTLQTPIDNRIFFAGEAVSSVAHSSLHGAYLTGQQAAAAIGAHLNQP